MFGVLLCFVTLDTYCYTVLLYYTMLLHEKSFHQPPTHTQNNWREDFNPVMLNTSTLQHLLLLYSLFYDDVDVDVDDNVDDDVQDASCTVKITSPKLKRGSL